MSTHKFAGLWLRGKTYWYKIRIADQVHSGSLQTRDPAEAIERLEAQRGVLRKIETGNEILKVMRQCTADRVKSGEIDAAISIT